MSKQMIKIISIFLAVCFLMSITAAAVSTDTVEKPNLADKDMAGMKLVKELSQEKNVFIKNLIFIKNLVIIKSNRHPLLRAAALKKLMTNKMDKTNMTDNTADNTADNAADNTANTQE
jgi:hypothetical protein